MARKYGPKASEKVEKTMHEFKHGKLKNGKTGKTVKSKKQATAIVAGEEERRQSTSEEERIDPPTAK